MKPHTFGRMACLFLLLGVMAPAFLSACNAQCPQVKRDYRSAIQQETSLSQELAEGDEPAQFGVAVKTELLEDIANVTLQTALKSGLNALSKVDVGGGQTVGLDTRGDIVNLRIEASDACDHCFRIGGDLDGSVGLDVPYVGEQSASLDGSLSLVAPLKLTRGKNGGGVLQLDLPEAGRLGKSSLNARLDGVQGSWARALQSQLSDALLSRLLDEVDAVELLAFEGPDFGIPGLDVFPVELRSDGQNGTVYAGFSTNIAALEGAQGIEPVTELADDQNLAFAFNPNLVVHGVSLMMQKDVVSRTYTTDGRPLRAGPARVVVSDFGFSKGRVGELPMALDFRVFNMPDDGGMCYSFDGRASGRVALRGQHLEVSLSDLDITDSSLPDSIVTIAKWSRADFLQGSKRLVRTSLDEESVSVPGGSLAFAGMSIELAGNAVVLKGTSAVHEDGDGDDGDDEDDTGSRRRRSAR